MKRVPLRISAERFVLIETAAARNQAKAYVHPLHGCELGSIRADAPKPAILKKTRAKHH